MTLVVRTMMSRLLFMSSEAELRLRGRRGGRGAKLGVIGKKDVYA